MSYRVITISRAPCSGARRIAHAVSEQLGIGYYDKELITLAAKRSGLSEEAIAVSEQEHTGSLLYSLYTLGNHLPLADQVYILQSNIIKDVAAEEAGVIVGRCADYVLADRPDVLKVFLYGDEEFRIVTGRKYNQLPEGDAEARTALRKADKKKADYYRYYTQNRWGQAEHYDLCLNAALGVDICVELIKTAYAAGPAKK